MIRRLRRHGVLLAAGALAVVAGVYMWSGIYGGWKKELRAAGFVADLTPPGGGDRVLVVAPHPDDETLGCAGLIQEAVARGAEVHVALMTNGDASELAVIFGEREFPASPRAFIDLGRRRQRESVRALEALGVPSNRIHFLGYPNNGLTALWRPEHWPYSQLYEAPRTRVSFSPYKRSLTPHAPYCGQQVLSDLTSLLLQVRPNYVFVTHPDDIHPDHWATSCFVQYALATVAVRGSEWARATTVYGYLIHFPRYPLPARFSTKLPLLPPSALIGDGAAWTRLPLSPEVALRKRKAIGDYRTQDPSFDRLLLRFARANETFEALSAKDLEAGRDREWRAVPSRRRGLAGAAVTGLRLAVSKQPKMSALITGAPQALPRNAYLGLDIRGWDEHGAPVLTTIYIEPGPQARATRLNAIDIPVVPVPVLQPERGQFDLPDLPVPPEVLERGEFLLSCWGSVRDRLIDPLVVCPMRLRPGDDTDGGETREADSMGKIEGATDG
jgi:LmbE family N-acetylglucosaminyl deacetylase